jgi:hypothetical protein
MWWTLEFFLEHGVKRLFIIELKLNLIICFKIFNLMMWWKYCMEVVRPYNSLLGIVLSIKFRNVFKGQSHIRLTFLPLPYWLANELKIHFWFRMHESTHVEYCFFQLCFKNLGIFYPKICLIFWNYKLWLPYVGHRVL